MWVRGLKLLYCGGQHKRTVAPYVGAWIETNLFRAGISLRVSHPMWVRGLKPLPSYVINKLM